MGILIIYQRCSNGYNNPVYDVHKNSALYTAKYGRDKSIKTCASSMKTAKILMKEVKEEVTKRRIILC